LLHYANLFRKQNDNPQTYFIFYILIGILIGLPSMERLSDQ